MDAKVNKPGSSIKENADEETETFPKVLSLKNKIGYGVGDLGNNFMFEMGQLYLLKYFTDVVGLPAATAGLVFLVAKVWDAFADLGVGTWIDNQKHISKHGKFRPFIIYAALPLAILLVANFSVPNFSLSGKEWWAYITYILFGTVFSVVNIAFGSMAPAMTKNSKERADLASARTIGTNIGTMITTIAYMPIVLMLPTEQMGYTVGAIIFAAGGVICYVICYFTTKENYHEDKLAKQHQDIKESDSAVTKGYKEILHSYAAIFKNKPLIMLCFANLFTFSAYNVKLAVQFYFAQYALHNIKIISYMSFFTIGSSIVAAFTVPSIVKKLGNKKTYMLGCIIWGIADLLGFFFVNNAINFTIFTMLSYFGNGMITVLNVKFIADAVEYGEWKTGFRSEGVTYSSYTFFRKLSQAMAGMIPGFVLALVGYVPNVQQTAKALLGIRGLVFIYPVAMAICTIILMSFYPLTNKMYVKIMDDLNKRHAQARAELEKENANNR